MFVSQNKNSKMPKTGINLKQKTTARARLTVTTCLYLSFNKRARSLSTLRAVVVSTETPERQIDKAHASYILENRDDIPKFKVEVYQKEVDDRVAAK